MLKKQISFVVLLLWGGVSFSQSPYPDSLFVVGEIYLSVSENSTVELSDPLSSPETNPAEIDDIFSQYGINYVEKDFVAFNTPFFDRLYHIKFTATSEVNSFISDLEQLSFISYAERIPIIKSLTVPNDPAVGTEDYHLEMMNAYEAFDMHHGGERTRIAIVDSDVQTTHEDLEMNYISGIDINSGINGSSSPNPPYTGSTHANPINPVHHSHGTHVAGIAAGVTNNEMGIASIGIVNDIYAVKTSYDSESGFLLHNVYNGVANAAMQSEVFVINMSWGSIVPNKTHYEVLTAARNAGKILVAAAGNPFPGNPKIYYPAAYGEGVSGESWDEVNSNLVIAVASVDQSLERSTGWGPLLLESAYGSWVDIAAYGTSIYSTAAASFNGGPDNNEYAHYSGTSMAAPEVTGLAGLMHSFKPAATTDEIINCIIGTANDDIYDGTSNVYASLGVGRMDAEKALKCLIDDCDGLYQPVAIISPSSTSYCEGDQDIVLTANTGNAYLWNTGESSQSIQVSSEGDYSVTVFFSESCKDEANITISPCIQVGYDCGCDGPESINIDAGAGMTPSQIGLDPNFLGGPGTPPPPDCIAIRGKLIIDAAQNFTGVSEIRMQPGAEIVILNGGSLRFYNNNVYGCERMWRGITVETGGILDMGGSTTRIADAQYAVTFQNHAVLNRCQNVTFENNHIGLYNNPGDQYGYFNFWNNPIRGNTFISDGLLPPFDLNLPYYSPDATFAGIYFSNNGAFNLQGSSSAKNVFTGIRNGIISDKGSIQIWHAVFDELSGAAGSGASQNLSHVSKGTGVRVDHNSHVLIQQCEFNGDDDKGVDALFSTVEVHYLNDFFNKYGIYNYHSDKLTVRNDNTFDNEVYGISSHFTNDSYIGIIENNHFKNANGINSSVPYGVLLNSFLGKGHKEILDNDFIFKNNMGYAAIRLSSGSTIEVGRNVIDYINPIGLGSAIQSQNTGDTKIYGNVISTDETLPLYSRGILIDASSGRICDNTISGFYQAIWFSGDNHADVRYNDLSASTNEYGLYGVSTTTQLGIQEPQSGNLWGSNLLYHAGNPTAIGNSKFKDAILPNPSQIITPNAGGVSWFEQSSLPPPTHDPCDGLKKSAKLTTEDIKTISGFYVDNPVKTWDTRRRVFGLMMEHPELQSQSGIADQFLSDNLVTSIGKLYQVDQAIDELYSIPAATQQLIDAYRQDMDDYGTAFYELNNLLSAATTEENADQIRTQINALMDDVLPKSQWMHQTKKAIDVNRVQGADQIITMNNAVSDVFLLEANEKAVNYVYLKVVVKGQEMTGAQQQLMYDIAMQCPEEGGRAVYKARSLVQIVEPMVFDNSEICGWSEHQVLPEVETESTDQLFHIQPNPTHDFVGITWSSEGTEREQEIRLDVMKPLGAIMRTFKFSEATGSKSLSLNIQPGIYSVNFYIDGQFVESQTIVIIE